jgi:esterase/lipase superfamily enzyme
MTMNAMKNELRDLHAARFAEMASLREMLVDAGHGEHSADLSNRMRDAVAEILRLQRAVSRLDD